MSASAMKVHLDKIGADGFELDTPLEKVWLTEMMVEARAPFEAVGDGRLKVRLDRVGDDVVHARGRVVVTLQAPCGRCLEGLRYDINVPIEVAMWPAGSEPVSGGEEGELSADDLGVTTYSGKEIDLTAIVRDEVFLEMPMNPVCSFAEARDCPNYQKVAGSVEMPVEEPKPGTDPRWAALKSIKLS